MGRDGFGMIQAHYIYCALYFYYYYTVIHNEIIIQLTIMLTGGGVQVVMRQKGGCKYRWSLTRSAATHLLLCAPVPNRPGTGTSPWPRGWGPLIYRVRYCPWFQASTGVLGMHSPWIRGTTIQHYLYPPKFPQSLPNQSSHSLYPKGKPEGFF